MIIRKFNLIISSGKVFEEAISHWAIDEFESIVEI